MLFVLLPTKRLWPPHAMPCRPSSTTSTSIGLCPIRYYRHIGRDPRSSILRSSLASPCLVPGSAEKGEGGNDVFSPNHYKLPYMARSDSSPKSKTFFASNSQSWWFSPCLLSLGLLTNKITMSKQRRPLFFSYENFSNFQVKKMKN